MPRYRPGWHKSTGLALLVVGLVVVILNDAMLLGDNNTITLLPGGHNELYLMAGLAVTAYSTWWFGWFDRSR